MRFFFYHYSVGFHNFNLKGFSPTSISLLLRKKTPKPESYLLFPIFLGMGYVFEELIRKFNEENNKETYAICKSDMMIKGNRSENICVGSTLSTDEFFWVMRLTSCSPIRPTANLGVYPFFAIQMQFVIFVSSNQIA